MSTIPALISGGSHQDERGKLIFFNELDLKPVRRFYTIEHPDTKVVRAWQAHKVEQKWFYVIAGTFKMVIVQPDDWDNPSQELEFKEFILKSESNQVLHVPGNYATGFIALEANSKMMVFSDFTVLEAPGDDFRFPNNMWYKW